MLTTGPLTFFTSREDGGPLLACLRELFHPLSHDVRVLFSRFNSLAESYLVKRIKWVTGSVREKSLKCLI